MTCFRIAWPVLVLVTGCPAAGDPGDPVGSSGDNAGSSGDVGETEAETGSDGMCLATGEACEEDAECCGGVCRSDGVCGLTECSPEGGTCEAPCCDDLPCDQNTGLCSSICADFEEPCDADEDCCEQACIDAACGVLG